MNKEITDRLEFSFITNSEEQKTVSVGEYNPIDLRIFDVAVIKKTIGKKIAEGDVGTIYEVKGSNSSRVYKVISEDEFKNGDEIRISKKAGKLGIGPIVYQSFLVKENLENYVFIEMEYAGKSLGKVMEDLVENTEIEEDNTNLEEKPLTEDEKEIQEIMRQLRAENTIVMTSNVTKKKVSKEEAISKTYEKPETFYFELFSRLKILAENNISYGDSHVGNIIPNTEKGVKIIDFDTAKIMTDTKTAALESINSIYNQIHFKAFQALKDLSSDSVELIKWFMEQSN